VSVTSRDTIDAPTVEDPLAAGNAVSGQLESIHGVVSFP
jgi:hypothetical protein